MENEQTIVIGIPGKWADKEAITNAILEKSGGYTYAGVMLLNTETKDSFGIEIFEHEPLLKQAFEHAGKGKISTEELQDINDHTFTIYVIGTAGSLDAAKKMMSVGQALLKAGGLGVKIETAGNAFSAAQWNALCALEDDARCFDAFVTKLQAEDEVCFTCGMHNFGFRDTIIGAVEVGVASYVLDLFSIYQILENPIIIHGEQFSVEEDLPTFQIYEEKEDNRYPKEDPLYNPNGLWILKPMEVKV